jgi:hypothetical protein
MGANSHRELTMGMIRKLTAVSTLGLVDYRSDKERTARYTKQTRDELRKQRKQDAPGQAQELPGESIADELRKLADLRDAGLLSDEEFVAQKVRLLSRTD